MKLLAFGLYIILFKSFTECGVVPLIDYINPHVQSKGHEVIVNTEYQIDPAEYERYSEHNLQQELSPVVDLGVFKAEKSINIIDHGIPKNIDLGSHDKIGVPTCSSSEGKSYYGHFAIPNSNFASYAGYGSEYSYGHDLENSHKYGIGYGSPNILNGPSVIHQSGIILGSESSYGNNVHFASSSDSEINYGELASGGYKGADFHIDSHKSKFGENEEGYTNIYEMGHVPKTNKDLQHHNEGRDEAGTDSGSETGYSYSKGHEYEAEARKSFGNEVGYKTEFHLPDSDKDRHKIEVEKFGHESKVDIEKPDNEYVPEVHKDYDKHEEEKNYNENDEKTGGENKYDNSHREKEHGFETNKGYGNNDEEKVPGANDVAHTIERDNEAFGPQDGYGKVGGHDGPHIHHHYKGCGHHKLDSENDSDGVGKSKPDFVQEENGHVIENETKYGSKGGAVGPSPYDDNHVIETPNEGHGFQGGYGKVGGLHGEGWFSPHIHHHYKGCGHHKFDNENASGGVGKTDLGPGIERDKNDGAAGGHGSYDGGHNIGEHDEGQITHKTNDHGYGEGWLGPHIQHHYGYEASAHENGYVIGTNKGSDHDIKSDKGYACDGGAIRPMNVLSIPVFHQQFQGWDHHKTEINKELFVGDKRVELVHEKVGINESGHGIEINTENNKKAVSHGYASNNGSQKVFINAVGKGFGEGHGSEGDHKNDGDGHGSDEHNHFKGCGHHV